MKEIPVGRAKNLIGQKFDHLTVLFRTEPPEDNKKKKDTWWACQCDCGNKELVRVRGDRFKSESSFSCGCAFKKTGRKIDDYIQIGNKYGKWTVLEFKGVINGHATYLCQCECGKIRNKQGADLKFGEKKNCGCDNCQKRNTLDITGQRFGKLIALEPTEKRRGSFVIWKCQCDCGNICEVSLGNLRNGDTKSCGCISLSYGEFCIQEMLNNNNISYTVQKSFNDCRFNNNYKARFDFFVNDEYIIEFDGEQHFKYRYNDNYNGWNNKDNFLTTREHDLVKNKYCFDNNIPLIRIPYDAKYDLNDLKLETTRFLLTPGNEKEYYDSRS